MQNPPQAIMSKEQFRQLRMQEKNNIYIGQHIKKQSMNREKKKYNANAGW